FFLGEEALEFFGSGDLSGEVGEDFREGGSGGRGDFCFYFFFTELGSIFVWLLGGGDKFPLPLGGFFVLGKLDCPANNPSLQGLEKEEIKAAIKEGETKQKEIKDEIKQLEKE
ncbi:12782_t:CDS:2, partial [Racocetra persica]